MAQEVLFNYAGDIIKKLGSQALQEIGLWWGLKDEIEKLKSTMSTIQAVLLDAEQKSAQNNQVRDWLGKLREVVDDADDLLDDFSTEALRQQVMSGNKVKKEVCLFFSSSNQIVYGIKMAHKIKAIRERLDAIAKDRHEFHFVGHITETPYLSRGRDPTFSYVGEEEVIGREDDKKEIIRLLFDSNIDDEIVIPIVGIGGLGKTTLAQYVFNDNTVKDKFELKFWVCVSDNFDVKLIVEKAIKSITNLHPGNLELESLQNRLREKISGKKYLLVLDDVWNEEIQKWLELKRILMCGAKGTRIIVTTRSEKVAKVTSTLPHYVLAGLCPTKSWFLFKKMVCKGDELENPEVREIGEKIINKCAGVPLAINTIASLLYFKSPKNEWLPFLENDLSKIAQNENSILQTLKLSYDHLSSHLKHCFAYCALFPKDHVIDVKELIHLWIAQGFIESSYSKHCLENIGLEYFMDLCWRSFFQEVERNELGNVSSCKMHDLMHDLATLVSGTGINVLNSNVKINIDEIRCRHFSIIVEESSLSPEIMVSLGKAEKLRTLFQLSKAFYISEVEVGEEFNKVVFSKLRCIRVCGLGGLQVKVPSYIKILKHLRYLDVSNNVVIETLPSSICQLQNLEVLRISSCINLKSLPKDIRKLINLRHLYNDDCYCLTHMPHGIGELTSLKTLSLFVVSKHVGGGGLDELNKLNNLRGSLEIRIFDEYVNLKKNGNKKGCNLREKEHLQSLSLSWNRDGGDNNSQEMLIQNLKPHPSLKELKVSEYRGMRLPNWISSLTNLVNLNFYNCYRCKNLPPLHRMSSLKSLRVMYLHDLEYMEMKMEGGGEGTGFFPSLEYLVLSNCPKLMGWRKNDDSEEDDQTIITIPFQFPCLSKLSVLDCQKLNWMPLFPSLDESLLLGGVSVQLLEQILNANPLSKLKKLEISHIPDLECLPRLCYLPHLISLRELSIWRCPKLKERYGNKNAEYWHIVSHISFIEVDDQTIQRDGRYLLDARIIRSDEGCPRYLPDGESIGDHGTEEGDN